MQYEASHEVLPRGLAKKLRNEAHSRRQGSFWGTSWGWKQVYRSPKDPAIAQLSGSVFRGCSFLGTAQVMGSCPNTPLRHTQPSTASWDTPLFPWQLTHRLNVTLASSSLTLPCSVPLWFLWNSFVTHPSDPGGTFQPLLFRSRPAIFQSKPFSAPW